MSAIDGVTRTNGKPIYASFQNYGGRELRAAQGYLTKMPAALVALLFGFPFDGEAGKCRSASRAVRGQGHMADAKKRRAIEIHAVQMAIEYYRSAGATRSEELGRPYDLKVILGGVERHVEVKGSVGEDISGVQLTQGEVDHARNYQATDLFVVDGVTAEARSSGEIVTVGGRQRLWTGWIPNKSALRPTPLRYTLP